MTINEAWETIYPELIYIIFPDPVIDEQLAERLKQNKPINVDYLLSILKFDAANLDDINFTLRANNIEQIDNVNILNELLKDNNVKNWLQSELVNLLPRIEELAHIDDEADIQNLSQLLSLKDSVGDDFTTGVDFDINTGSRDYPFLYIDGKYLKGSPGTVHQVMINKYIEDNNINEKLERNIDKASVNTKFASGHVVNNMAFISATVNYTAEEVADALRSKFKKIYFYDEQAHHLTRLATKGDKNEQKGAHL